jgi:malonate-semialdehyde dehydrogenase (acetylating)/methylmalonate-semialdehyde dehydrogenase
MDDADRSSTIKAIVGAAFGAAGQCCMALSVVILVGNMSDTQGWVDEVIEEAKKLIVGNGFQVGVDVGELNCCQSGSSSCFNFPISLTLNATNTGPHISKETTERAVRIIQSSIDEGAVCRLDGRGVVVDGFEDGNYLGPTVIDRDTMNALAIMQ